MSICYVPRPLLDVTIYVFLLYVWCQFVCLFVEDPYHQYYYYGLMDSNFINVIVEQEQQIPEFKWLSTVSLNGESNQKPSEPEELEKELRINLAIGYPINYWFLLL